MEILDTYIPQNINISIIRHHQAIYLINHTKKK